MTYGEACVAEQRSLKMVNGEWVKTVKIENKAKRMKRKDAGRYTNTVLFAYWLDRLSDKYTLAQKKDILNYLMFKKPKDKILFKGKL